MDCTGPETSSGVPFAEVISTVPLSEPLVIFTSVGLKVGED
jgi:hypothetical protein